MKVSGFSFIRNAVINDYPIVESVNSILPVCDDFYIAVGQSTDQTRALIGSIHPEKIHIIDSIWDENLRIQGNAFAAETNKAFDAVPDDTDWAFYIQGDECLHEQYLDPLYSAMKTYLHNKHVDGLLFKFIHFYGSYDYIGSSRRWYRNEIRIVKNDKRIRSYRDAQGFRKAGHKLNVKQIPVTMYHYGWAKNQEGLNKKIRNFSQFYHDQNWVDKNIPVEYTFDYKNADRLIGFTGTHPKAMLPRITQSQLKLAIDLNAVGNHLNYRRRFLQAFEDLTGYRIGEYKNYTLVK